MIKNRNKVLNLEGQIPRTMIYEAEKGKKSPKDRKMYNKLYL